MPRSTLPSWSPATHSRSLGQASAAIWLVGSGWLICHADVTPVGRVAVNTSPLLVSRTHREADGQWRLVIPVVATGASFQDAPLAGWVETMTFPFASPATHSRVLGQVMAVMSDLALWPSWASTSTGCQYRAALSG